MGNRGLILTLGLRSCPKKDQLVSLTYDEILCYHLTDDLFFAGGQADDWSKDVDARVQHAVDFGKKCGFAKAGQNIVCVTGWRKGAGASNTVRIE